MSKILLFSCTLCVVVATAACSPEPEQSPVTPGTPPDTPIEPQDQPPQALDLSRDVLDDIVAEGDNQAITEPEPSLPDLFDADADSKRVKVSGKLLTDEEATTLRDRVEGAQVKIEVNPQ